MSKINAIAEYFTPTNLYDYKIKQSLRFEDGDDAYLNRTFGTPTNNKKWTYSVWMKRGNLSTNQAIFSADFDGSNYWDMRFNTSDQIYIQNRVGASNLLLANTTAVFRDVSAFYHIVFVYDSDNATASDRAILYVNGVSQTLSASPGSGDASGYNVSGEPHHIGVSRTLTSIGGIWSEFDGYQAEINFVDGQALDPTNFGETKNGIWIAKKYTGTYGNNGFYLDFADGSALGDDESGNGNDFTSSGLASTDVVLDSPTNNFPIILDDKGGTSQVYSEGNLHANIGSNSYAAKSSMFVPMDSGKWYVEALSDASGASGAGLGTYTPNSMNTLASISYYFTGNIVLATDMIHYYSSGTIYNAGSSVQSSLTTVGDKDIIGMLIDTDAKTVQFYVNGTASGTAETMANTTDPVAAQLHGHNSRPFMFNFGTDSSFANRKTSGSANATDANGIGDFYYTPPIGAKAICSDNLPEPSISPLHGEQPEDYFNTVLYTGNGTTQSITGVGFQPDWTWIKRRDAANNHGIFDSVRGATKRLSSNRTNAEDTLSGVTSFDSDGFSLGADYNESGASEVAWNWLAGGTAVSNTEGSITSSVSANTKAGFSILNYVGTGALGTVGHGLSTAPDFIIRRVYDDAWSWLVYHSALGSNKYLLLNTTAAAVDDAGFMNDTDPTSSVMTVNTFGSDNNSGGDAIAYCFHSVEGYSKIGSYTGNGSSDGPFVHCGFRPAWIMIKRTDNVGSWAILDNKRNTFNVLGNTVWANLSSAESSYTLLDFTSNGFKHRDTSNGYNTSSANYIFIAYAESPFKYANAR